METNTTNCTRASDRNVFLGVGYMLHGTLYIILYIPCLIVICRPALIKHQCYKIMAALGFIDVIALAAACFATGLVSVVGDPLCFEESHMISRIVGSSGLAVWVSYGLTLWFLSINRLIGMYWPHSANSLFPTAFVIGYVIAALMVGIVLFIVNTGADAGLTYQPSIGLAIFETDSNPFVSWFTTVFAYFIANTLVIIYCLIVIKLYRNTSVISGNREAFKLAKMERSVTIQSVVMCSVTATAAWGYTVLPMFNSPLWSWTLINVVWQMAHGVNAVIYLTLNQTIINGVKEMVGIEVTTFTTIQTPSHSKTKENIPMTTTMQSMEELH